jgi:PhoH-like ATPase
MAKKKEKIYVLDTSVLIHDHQAITNFENNHVAIPITVLEELDKFKVGNDSKNFSAREVIRFIDKLSATSSLQNWISLGKNKGDFKVILETTPAGLNAEDIYAHGKNDHKIINSALFLKETERQKDVIMITKDINLRIKAKALGIAAEDYETGKVSMNELEDASTLTIENLESDVIREIFTRGKIDEDGILGDRKIANGYYILKNGKSSSLAVYNPLLDQIERIEKECRTSFCLQCLIEPGHKIGCPTRRCWNR